MYRLSVLYTIVSTNSYSFSRWLMVALAKFKCMLNSVSYTTIFLSESHEQKNRFLILFYFFQVVKTCFQELRCLYRSVFTCVWLYFVFSPSVMKRGQSSTIVSLTGAH